MKKMSLFLTILLLVLAGCSNSASYKNISAQQLKKMMKNKDFVLMDVHMPEQKHIKGTDLVIPYEHVAHMTDQLPADKDKKIVVYCRSGHMSQTASQALIDLGYTNVYNLEGGMEAWLKQP